MHTKSASQRLQGSVSLPFYGSSAINAPCAVPAFRRLSIACLARRPADRPRSNRLNRKLSRALPEKIAPRSACSPFGPVLPFAYVCLRLLTFLYSVSRKALFDKAATWAALRLNQLLNHSWPRLIFCFVFKLFLAGTHSLSGAPSHRMCRSSLSFSVPCSFEISYFDLCSASQLSVNQQGTTTLRTQVYTWSIFTKCTKRKSMHYSWLAPPHVRNCTVSMAVATHRQVHVYFA